MKLGKMLSLNPKDRPTIVDVLNKPIIKRRVVNYMAEIFSGQYPEANMPNDVDDVFYLLQNYTNKNRFMLIV